MKRDSTSLNVPEAATDSKELSAAKRALLRLRLHRRLPSTAAGQSIHRADRGAPLPLSFAQQRLWFLDRLLGNSALYNIPLAYRLKGKLDVEALVTGINEIVRRHEALRTTFVTQQEEPRQIIEASVHIPLSCVDLSAHSAGRKEELSLRLIAEEATDPFDLQRGPLLRAKVVRLSEHDQILMLTMHHIVSDGWSREVFCRELASLYSSCIDGRPSSLPELPIQYADYAVWQRKWLRGERLERQLAYWRRQLEGIGPLELPTDQPRPMLPSHRGATLRLQLSPELSDALQNLSRREGMTLFMTLLAAFQMLLHRYSGQDDIAVGTPIAGRIRPELEGLIGFFVNTLVLRTSLSGNPSFRELLNRVRDVTLGAYSHQDLPFEKLVEELHPQRDPTRHPLFDVLINLFTESAVSLDLRGLEAQLVNQEERLSKFALTLYIGVQASGIQLTLVYQTELFAAARMTHLLDQYRHLLEQVVAAPEQPLHRFSLVTPAAAALLPDPTAAIPEPSHEPVTTQILRWAKRTPRKAAIMQGDQHWDYHEVAMQAMAVAATLRAHGIGRGDVVALVGHPTAGLIVSMCAVLMSGGVFVTIDPALPLARQRLMRTESGAKISCRIGPSHSEEGEAMVGADVPFLQWRADLSDALPPPGAAGSKHDLPDVDGNDPAYVFFTSGSTGNPKAILGCHKGLSHFLQWQRATFLIGPDDRIAQLAGLSFDVVLREVFLPLTSGATLCLPEERDRLSVLAWLERERISLAHATPTLLQSWMLQDTRDFDLSGLRWLLISGEPLADSLVRRWRERFSGSGQLVNLYGPTETTMIKCFHRVPEEAAPGIQPIGRPLPETQVLILSPEGRLCAPGELGEIVLRTPFRTLGYLNLPEETRQRFRPNPFRQDADDLLYFTGDSGRCRVDGILEFVGRLDDQVKIRGVRVEPAEVTATLTRHQAVRRGLVVASADAEGQYDLVAYVVTDSRDPITAGQLRTYLGSHLPSALIPRHFVFLDELPLTATGKVDRRALPAPERGEPATSDDAVAPQDRTEKSLRDIFAHVLRMERVGLHDGFFDLGGHSLLAMQVLARIREFFGIELPLRTLFEKPTVAELANAIRQLRETTDLEGRALTPIGRQVRSPDRH